jgi:hypothetical protein
MGVARRLPDVFAWQAPQHTRQSPSLCAVPSIAGGSAGNTGGGPAAAAGVYGKVDIIRSVPYLSCMDTFDWIRNAPTAGHALTPR